MADTPRPGPRPGSVQGQTTATSGTKLKVTQVRSTIGSKQNQRATLRTLGLRKIRQTVVRDDTPQIRGMIHTVRHLVTVEEVRLLMTIKIHHLRPAPGVQDRTRPGSAVVRAASAARPPVEARRAPRPARTCPPRFEGGQMPLHMRLPKLKGFKNRFRVEYQVVNVGDLARLFPEGGTVGPDELVAAGAVRKQPAGQGARRRRPRRGHADRHRARVLRQRPREDHRRGRHRHRAVARCGRRPVGADRPPSRAGPHPSAVERPLLESSRARRRPHGPGALRQPDTGGSRVLSAFRSALATPDLRKKILFTLGIVAVYRLGATHPVARGLLPERAGVPPAGPGRRELRASTR